MTRQVWFCGSQESQIAATTRWPPSGSGGSAIGDNRPQAIPAPCGLTIQNVIMVLDAAPGGVTSRTLTMFVNNVATAIVITISGTATTAQDTTHAIHVNAGDLIDWRSTRSGITASARLRFTYETVTDTATDAVMWSASENASAGAGSVRFSHMGGGVDTNPNGTELNTVFPAAVAGTITAIYAYDNTAPGSDNTRGYDLNVRVNSANAGSTIQLRGATQAGNATGLSVAFSIADLICLRWQNIVGANTGCIIGLSFCYTPSAGVPMLAGVDQTGPASTTVQYAPLQPGRFPFNAAGAGNPNSFVVGPIVPITLSGLRVRIASTPAVGATVTYSLQDSVVGALNESVTITNGSTTGNDGTHSDVLVAPNLYAIQHGFTGGGSGAPVGWCFGVAQGGPPLRMMMGYGV